MCAANNTSIASVQSVCSTSSSSNKLEIDIPVNTRVRNDVPNVVYTSHKLNLSVGVWVSTQALVSVGAHMRYQSIEADSEASMRYAPKNRFGVWGQCQIEYVY